jgi:hypothetical protein
MTSVVVMSCVMIEETSVMPKMFALVVRIDATKEHPAIMGKHRS